MSGPHTLRTVDISAAPQFQRDVAALVDHGARAAAEYIAELIMLLPVGERQHAFDRLAAYRGIPQEQLTATGGDRFPAIPLRVVKP
jgi:hypothetical protein